MDHSGSSYRSDEQLDGMLDQTSEWRLRSRDRAVLATFMNLRDAIVGRERLAASGHPVVAIAREQPSEIIIFNGQMERVARRIHDGPPPAPLEFRLHLLDRDRLIVAVDRFLANDPEEALVIASAIFNACQDVVTGCEVWQGAETLATERHPGFLRLPRVADLTARQQELVCEREAMLRDSFERIHASELLMASLTFLDAFRATREA
jgi:hypothetical protein